MGHSCPLPTAARSPEDTRGLRRWVGRPPGSWAAREGGAMNSGPTGVVTVPCRIASLVRDVHAGLIQHPAHGEREHTPAVARAGEVLERGDGAQVLRVERRLEIRVGP